MNTKNIGDISEAQIIARLLLLGKTVLQPFGDNQRYDLVIDDRGKFIRIQVKTGKLKSGVITFNTCSSTIIRRSVVGKNYKGDIEFFGVYCPQNNKCYLVPITEVSNSATKGSLRVDPTKNKQNYRCKYARDYEI